LPVGLDVVEVVVDDFEVEWEVIELVEWTPVVLAVFELDDLVVADDVLLLPEP